MSYPSSNAQDQTVSIDTPVGNPLPPEARSSHARSRSRSPSWTPVDAEQERQIEDRILSNLKADAAIRTHVESSVYPQLEGEVPRFSGAAKAQTAFGKYAAAVAMERNVRTQDLEREVKPELTLTEDDLLREMKEDAARKMHDEMGRSGARGVAKAGPASKAMSAVGKYREAVARDRGCEAQDIQM
ncbi:hypothetical protein HK102_003280 [Quaeritorhiza haematococci]|nr:hypothetical protein HK102_003280 [Quaeritorhiza haematococci]